MTLGFLSGSKNFCKLLSVSVDRDSRTDLSHDGLKSDVSFFMTTLSHAHGHPLSRSWLVQVHKGTQEECTDAVVCRLKLDCGWVC